MCQTCQTCHVLRRLTTEDVSDVIQLLTFPNQLVQYKRICSKSRTHPLRVLKMHLYHPPQLSSTTVQNSTTSHLTHREHTDTSDISPRDNSVVAQGGTRPCAPRPRRWRGALRPCTVRAVYMSSATQDACSSATCLSACQSAPKST